jgi:hypothetical protein
MMCVSLWSDCVCAWAYLVLLCGNSPTVVLLRSYRTALCTYTYTRIHHVSFCISTPNTLRDVITHRLNPEQITAAAVFVAQRVNSAFFAQGQPQSGAKWIWLSGYIEKLARYVLWCCYYCGYAVKCAATE